MKNKKWSLLAMLFAVLLVLAACSGNDDDSSSESTDEEGTTTDTTTSPAEELLSLEVTNEGDAITGGTLQVAMVKDEPFQGILLS